MRPTQPSLSDFGPPDPVTHRERAVSEATGLHALRRGLPVGDLQAAGWWLDIEALRDEAADEHAGRGSR